ncbi:phosphotransferase [Microbacterium sp. SORGH_AS_0888]|uniref:phosphotransferase n=1 Tax=Microbacterium sp. SORGH_AS_0888 TaxID=3041791 RepID=UPI002785F749|nr:phosphotransferase [Microbacterium sp. SORGH_AS_0888]MDQ1128200.1 macrolide phosphotransferase [Microbacterium sp. SORGH_AS_0888]
MSRSPLTLAAAVTAAMPDAVVRRTRALGDDGDGRYDSAVVSLAGGETVVIRVATDAAADRALRDELRVLEALTPGIRSLLPFRVPRAHGRTTLGGATAGVVDFLDGYRVPTADLPPGGVAGAIGRAIAAVHDLPVAVAREEGFAVRGADTIRVELSRMVDRAAGTGHVDPVLRDRWRTALDDDLLWRFEPTVVFGGTAADCFLFEDDDEGPHLTGVLGWEGLSVGDPAADLAWTASAPDAAASVLDAYLLAATRAADPLLAERARLYAELEFADWLLHGVDADDDAVVRDAAALLGTLAETTRGLDLLPRTGGDVHAAVELLDRLPAHDTPRGDTSMQTDAYDPAELSAYLPENQDGETGPVETLPIDLAEWTAHGDDAERLRRG